MSLRDNGISDWSEMNLASKVRFVIFIILFLAAINCSFVACVKLAFLVATDSESASDPWLLPSYLSISCLEILLALWMNRKSLFALFRNRHSVLVRIIYTLISVSLVIGAVAFFWN